MAGDRIEYTLGVGVEIKNTADQVRILQDTLNKENFSIKTVMPDVNIGKADEIFERLKKEYKEVTEIAVDYKTVVDDTGKTIGKFADSISFKGVGAMDELRKHQEKLNEGMADFGKKMKVFNDYSLNADKAKASAKNLGDEQKKAVEGTAEKLQAAIQKWNEHAEKLNLNEKEAKELEAEIERLNRELQVNQAETKTSANAMQSFGLRLANAIKQTGAYTVALRASRLAQQELRKAFSYAIELDIEMTKIKVLQVEGAKTEAQINGLAKSFNDLAKEMAISTLEVAHGSVEWLRQGKTIAETQELLRSTVMLSKLGAIDTANATEKLTATLNAFNLEAKDAELIVDKLVAVDNIAATSVNELATAMQYSASIASQSGVSFDQLTSYIAVISETTRQSAQTIGQAFKTIFSRMQMLREGKIDEDGIGINKVEDALFRVGILLRDGEGQFRNFGTVLEELGAIWEGLNGTLEQSNIAAALGGTRQVNLIYALLNNMNDALKFQEEQANATGLATERYGIYLDSVQAKIDTFKATLEGLYQSLISSDLVKWFIDFGQSILDSIEKAGGLQTVIKRALGIVGVLKGVPLILKAIKGLNIGVSLIKATKSVADFMQGMDASVILMKGLQKGLTAVNASEKTLTITNELLSASIKGGNKGFLQYILTLMGVIPATDAATGATLTFGAAVKAALGPIALVTLALGALVGAFILIKKEADSRNILKSAEAIEKLNQEEEKYRAKEKDAQEKLDHYKKLTRQLELATKGTQEYTKKKEELKIAHEELIKVFPELRGQIKAEGEITDDTTEKIQKLIDKERELADTRKASAEVAAKKAIFGTETPDLGEGTKTLRGKKYARGTYNGMYDTILPIAVRWANYKTLSDPNSQFFNPDEALDEYYAFEESLTALVTNFENLDIQLQAFLMSFVGGIHEKRPQMKEELSLIFETLLSVMQNEVKKYENLYTDDFYYMFQDSKNIPPTLKELRSESYAQLYDEVSNTIEKIKLLEDALDKTSNSIVIDPELVNSLYGFGVHLDKAAGKLYILDEGTEVYINSSDDLLELIINNTAALQNMSDEQRNYFIALINANMAIEEQADGLKELLDTSKLLTDAIDEQTKNQTVSLETAMRLKEIEAQLSEEYGNNYFQIEQLGDGYTFAADAVYEYANSQLLSEFNTIKSAAALAEGSAELNLLEQAALAAAQGDFIAASSFIAMAESANKAIPDIEKLKNIIYEMASIWQKVNIASGGGGRSGGGSGARKEDPRIKETEKLIKAKEKEIDLHKKDIDLYKKEIDAIKERQKQYSDWISEKKKSLDLAKKESDYYKEQQKKLRDIAKIRKEIAKLELDNSPEARAKILSLQEDLYEKEEELKDDTEERRHELQIRALDDLKEAFDKAAEEQIKGIQDIIDGIDEIIKGIQEQIKEYREFIQELREQERDSGSGLGTSTYRSSGGSGETLLATMRRTSADTVGYGSNEEELGMPVANAGDKPTQYSHLGGAIDIHTQSSGGNVHAPQTGVITYMGDTGSGFGKTIAIKNADGRIVTLSHLSEFGDLEVGQRVDKTDIIGKIDDNWTGSGSAEHIHMATFQELNGVVVQTATNFEDFNRNLDYANAEFPAGIFDFVTSLEDGRKTIVKVGGKVDKELTEQAEYISKATGLTSKELEGLADIVKSGAINMKGGVSSIIGDLKLFGYDINLTGEGLMSFFDFLMNISKKDVDVESKPVYKPLVPKPGGRKPGGQVEQYAFHSGGLVESHHDGDFAGGLNSNEVFAKLLKGEYVATESQMERFLSKTLPTLMGANLRIQPNAVNTEISLSMPINVEGNMDKSVIADIEVIANRAVEKINRQVASMGHIRTSNQFIS